MTSFVGSSGGVSEAANAVVQVYKIKEYTMQEYNQIANPDFTDPNIFAKLATAYLFFQDIKNNTAFTVPGSTQVFDFSVFKNSPMLDTLETKVDTLLKSFDKVDIQDPNNGGKYTLPVCFNANGSDDDGNPGAPVTLYDLISNPNGNFLA